MTIRCHSQAGYGVAVTIFGDPVQGRLVLIIAFKQVWQFQLSQKHLSSDSSNPAISFFPVHFAGVERFDRHLKIAGNIHLALNIVIWRGQALGHVVVRYTRFHELFTFRLKTQLLIEA